MATNRRPRMLGINLWESAVKSLVAKMPRGIVQTTEQQPRPLGQFTIFSPYCAASWATGGVQAGLQWTWLAGSPTEEASAPTAAD